MEFAEEDFWVSHLNIIMPCAAREAVDVLVPCVTIYPHETGFLCFVHIENICRKRLDRQHDIRVPLSTKTRSFAVIIGDKQQQRRIIKQLHPQHTMQNSGNR